MFDSPDRDRGESRYGPEHGFGGFQGDYDGGRQQGGFGGYGDYAEGRRSFSAHPDDHYRSWRDRQMEASSTATMRIIAASASSSSTAISTTGGAIAQPATAAGQIPSCVAEARATSADRRRRSAGRTR